MRQSLIFIICFGLFGCGASDNLEKRLADAGCTEKQWMEGISTIPSPEKWSESDLCQIGKDLREEPKLIARNTIDALCYQIAEKTGDETTFRILQKSLKETAELDPKNAQAAKVMELCDSTGLQEAEIERASKEINLRVFSLGTIRVDKKHCPAYLMETNTDVDGVEKAYSLHGLGECKGMATTNALTFHPVMNPSGVYPGDFFRKIMKYDGSIPEKWMFRNEEYPMYKSR